MKNYAHPTQMVYGVKGFVTGVGVSVTVMLILTGVSSAILVRGVIAEGHGRIAQALIHALAVMSGCFITNAITSGKIIRNVVVVGVGYSIICAIANALMLGAEYRSVHYTIAPVLIGMIAAWLLSGMKLNKETKKYKRWKM